MSRPHVLDALVVEGPVPESVEISRLSIWLRTARRGERLETLDNSITVGDSLRAEDEHYDVIVGNPTCAIPASAP